MVWEGSHTNTKGILKNGMKDEKPKEGGALYCNLAVSQLGCVFYFAHCSKGLHTEQVLKNCL